MEFTECFVFFFRDTLSYQQGLPEVGVYPGEEKTPTPVFDLGQAG